jgi:glycosyltransferase involved in cell wall biosynthesis
LERLRSEAVGIGDYVENWLELRAMRRADGVYCPSALLAKHLAETFGIRTHIVRPPFELASGVASVQHLGLPDRFLVHAGLLSKIKGSDLVIASVRALMHDVPDLRVVLAGGAERGFSLDRGDPVRRHIVSLGRLPPDHLLGVLSRAVASVVPSRVDNLPNTAIESLLLGVPVICTENSSVDEIVKNGVNGIVVPQEDVEQLASAMKEAWSGKGMWSTNERRGSLLMDNCVSETTDFWQLVQECSSAVVAHA